MRQSQLFTKTRREAPSDEVSKNAILLTRAGFINKEMAGVYDFLPLGLRVLNKVIGVIKEEMNALGAQELFMSSLQRKELWERSKRWSDEEVDIWFKTKLKDGGDLGLGFTHEEPIANMLEQFVSSYKDLPFSVYQFQTKFRNETRAKSGIMRTREFIMKDLYSFSHNEEEHQKFYDQVAESYKKIFARVGLGDKTYMTQASGGVFSKFSHEFQTLCESGEDLISITDEDKKEAINKEISEEDLKWQKATEVGNIFTLGTRFSDPYLKFKDEAGQEIPVFMGSYGIGPARIVGTIVETLSDEKGIVWPEAVAPFQVHLISLGNDKAKAYAEDVYQTLMAKNIEVLYDDRDLRAGEKFADADLIGIPTRIVVGDKTLESHMLEVKERNSDEVTMMILDKVIAKYK